jgi:hypothetical protein
VTAFRRLTLAAAVVALVASSAALAAGGVVGTYKTTIRNSGHLNGKWGLVLARGGSYTVSMNGAALARGSYAAAATTITFSGEKNSGCSGRGVYAWTKSGNTLTFIRKRETASCKARAAVLAHSFTQVR